MPKTKSTKDGKWFFPNVLKSQGEEMDELINKHGNEIHIYNRPTFIRVAVAAMLDKLREELKEKGKKV